ncbi:hypothetical protein AUK10_01560 [Candidatus Gracilibacteria bacterium CG2_30_37_12]|nr:MAG: hypothetical protein AUK10_01560 [Candidatus Gracilibacteria bacterium CG2_30_37_12]
MKKHIYLLTIFIIFLSSTISVLLLFFYMNVENNLMVGLTIMGIASFLASSSFLSLLIYFFKKIYYRGEVYISTIHTSLRQGILFSLSSMGIITFYSLGVLNPKTGGLLIVIALLFELMIQSVSQN